MHRCVYDMRPDDRAIVHLHSTHSVAVSCLGGLDEANCMPPLTAYYVMRVGKLPMVPYFPPGDERLASAVRQLAAKHAAVLLANHGPVVAGKSLDGAAGAIEELEATAKLFLMLQDRPTRPLSPPVMSPNSKSGFRGPDFFRSTPVRSGFRHRPGRCAV